MNSPIRITDQTWPDSTAPVVSVFNWVYNHKDFIRESIESILMQETTFPVEIIIQDDASNDGTREILEEYQNKYPNLFNNILFSENQYSQGKSIMDALFEKPRGKYIALTHGDDYWTDRLKLQKQVDFLESNPNYSMCYCKSYKKYENSGEFFPLESNFKSRIQTIDLVNDGWSIFTATMLFRKPQFYPKWLRYCVHGDFAIQLFLSTQGDFGFIDEFMSVYRKHNDGISNTLTQKQHATLADTFQHFGNSNREYKSIIDNKCSSLYFSQVYKEPSLKLKLYYLNKSFQLNRSIAVVGLMKYIISFIKQKISPRIQ